MKILFSKHDKWEKNILHAFQSSGHEIVFSDVNENTIANADLVVPLTIADLLTLQDHRTLLAKNIIPLPTRDAILLCDDKLAFNLFMIDKGFGDYIPSIGKQLEFPYLLKKRIDNWGENTHIIHNGIEEHKMAQRLSDPEYFCQELIQSSKEYATHLVIRDGQVLCSMNIEYSFDKMTPIKGKDKIQQSVNVPVAFMPLFMQVLDTIGFEGLCCVNYKVINNHPYIFEINPRFGGSLSLLFNRFVDVLCPSGHEVK